MRKQSERHLIEQINNRNPNLIVYWTGGNEMGYLKNQKGKGYKKLYRKVIRSLKEGAPEASRLLIGPLDQGKGALRNHLKTHDSKHRSLPKRSRHRARLRLSRTHKP